MEMHPGKKNREQGTRYVVDDGDNNFAAIADLPGAARCTEQVRDVKSRSAAPPTHQQQQRQQPADAEAHRCTVVGKRKDGKETQRVSNHMCTPHTMQTWVQPMRDFERSHYYGTLKN